MTRPLLKLRRILAIDPTSQGFGFAVIEEPEQLIDWGNKMVNTAKGDKNTQCLKRIIKLIEYYHPNVIVVENATGKGSRRCRRVQKLIQEIVVLASAGRIRTKAFSRSQIRKAFSQYQASTKHQIATAIAGLFPELAPHLPRFRKPWMSEDNRMSIFDAAALALTFLLFEHSSRKVSKPDSTVTP
jgi:Holliday junction resolvasome RuvABC endonuclease subunit